MAPHIVPSWNLFGGWLRELAEIRASLLEVMVADGGTDVLTAEADCAASGRHPKIRKHGRAKEDLGG